MIYLPPLRILDWGNPWYLYSCLLAGNCNSGEYSGGVFLWRDWPSFRMAGHLVARALWASCILIRLDELGSYQLSDFLTSYKSECKTYELRCIRKCWARFSQIWIKHKSNIFHEYYLLVIFFPKRSKSRT